MAEASDPVQAPTATLDKKKSIILGIIGLAFIILIFWKVIPQIGSYSDAANALRGMSVVSIILIGVSVVLYLLAYGLPFMAAAPGLRFWRSQQTNQAAFAISNGIPGGGAVGLAVQFGMLTSFRITPTAATAAITAVGLWSTFVTLGLPILGVAALAISGQGNQSHTAVAVLGLGILIAAVTLFVLVMRSEKLATAVGRFGNALITPLRGRIKALAKVDLVGPITKFRGDMYGLLKSRWAWITGAQLAVSLTQFLILYVALRGVEAQDGKQTSILVVFAAFAISQLGLMVPITPGGLGTVDAAMIALMVSFGVSNGDATAADLVWRATSYIPQIIIGIIAIALWYRKAGQVLASVGGRVGGDGTAGAH
ncbi:MAG: lysylphosphatidylglycerol synthase transmembrane domain-containing protein [Actinomycetota bacterium]